MLTDHPTRAGHYNRALEEAVQTHKSQWAKDWESKNPLSGGATFTTMMPTQRVRKPFSPSGAGDYVLVLSCTNFVIAYSPTNPDSMVPLLLRDREGYNSSLLQAKPSRR